MYAQTVWGKQYRLPAAAWMAKAGTQQISRLSTKCMFSLLAALLYLVDLNALTKCRIERCILR